MTKFRRLIEVAGQLAPSVFLVWQDKHNNIVGLAFITILKNPWVWNAITDAFLRAQVDSVPVVSEYLENQ